jgi:hypothetical protein
MVLPLLARLCAQSPEEKPYRDSRLDILNGVTPPSHAAAR